MSFWGAPTHADIMDIWNFLLQLKNQRFGSKTVCGFSIIFILIGIMTFSSRRIHAFFKQNINFNKNEMESKTEIPTLTFRETNLVLLERRTLCFSSNKNRKLKVKLWWVGACEKKKRAFLVPFILSEGNFFKIYVLSQCIVYWMQFQNIHTFTYQKTLLHIPLLLVSKIVESLQWILRQSNRLRRYDTIKTCR